MFDTLAQHGLQINYDKTLAMLKFRGKHSSAAAKLCIFRTLKGAFLKLHTNAGLQTIRLVHSFPFLGACFSYGNFEHLTFQKRIRSSRLADHLLQPWLYGKHNFSRHTRLHLWRQCVFACGTYGIIDTGFQKAQLQALDILFMKQLRKLYCAPVHLDHMSHATFLEQDRKSVV